jgi:hypothetical protein
MLSFTIKRSDPDFQDVIIRNDTAADLVDGDVVEWQTGSGKNLGVDVIKSTADDVKVAGVIVQTIEPGGFGRCRAYGYHSNVKGTNGEQATVDVVVKAGVGVAKDATLGTDDFRIFGSVVKVLATGDRVGVFLRCM